MKYKAFLFLLVLSLLFTLTGCSKSTKNTNSGQNAARQRIMIVAVDKETKAPIKEAKVYILGNNTMYTTDEMGKTSEIEVELNKDYLTRYIDEVSSKILSGLVNILAIKDGYGKHLEIDYSIYPGNSISLVRIEMSKGNKNTINQNVPDTNHIQNLAKAYESYEGQGIKSDNMMKYKITLVDENGKALQDAKVVIPEAQISAKTNNKGVCEVDVPSNDSYNINNPVKKDYGEITILTYKKGHSSRVLLKVHLDKNGQNSISIKMKKCEKPRIEYEVFKPASEWVEGIMNLYK